ncbi:unnamed protein product [Moneuplotes crassus]|uniref:Uncharacterized protein n=1 Tax=Euplotes crassus TaxID=5936 RepID=A0AAD1X5R8_EUPCR|nr:unnamed protein product [Moneuplotes crassus]
MMNCLGVQFSIYNSNRITLIPSTEEAESILNNDDLLNKTDSIFTNSAVRKRISYKGNQQEDKFINNPTKKPKIRKQLNFKNLNSKQLQNLESLKATVLMGKSLLKSPSRNIPKRGIKSKNSFKKLRNHIQKMSRKHHLQKTSLQNPQPEHPHTNILPFMPASGVKPTYFHSKISKKSPKLHFSHQIAPRTLKN